MLLSAEVITIKKLFNKNIMLIFNKKFLKNLNKTK